MSFYARFARSRYKLSLFAPIRDALYLPLRIERELVIREKRGRNFDDAQSLVDTRSV